MNEEAAEIANRIRVVTRPGFLAAYLMLLLREDAGRVKLGSFSLSNLARLANNLVSIGKIEVAYSELLTPYQLDRGMDCLKALSCWEPSDTERFQAREDIIIVKNAFENLDPSKFDKHGRIGLDTVQNTVTDLWRKAVETPQAPQPTKK